MAAVIIPVMAKCRIGHFVEAQILEALGVDYIDESEVLTPADEEHHVDKQLFKVPFVCGCRDLGEALRRIAEGAAMIRTKGEAGTGDVVEAVRHMRAVTGDIRQHSTVLREEELWPRPRNCGRRYELVRRWPSSGKLPVPNFSAGGIATPADAALMMQLGAEASSSARASSSPTTRPARQGHRGGDDALRGSGSRPQVSEELGEPMVGISTAEVDPAQLLETRGW